MRCHKSINKSMLSEKSTKLGLIGLLIGFGGFALIWFGKVPGDPIASLGALGSIISGFLGVAYKEAENKD